MTAIDVVRFVQQADAQAGDADALPGDGIDRFGFPGCFVIATYGKDDSGKKLASYLYACVGKHENVAQGVREAVSRTGDPDLYADVKYEQDVRAYVFICAPDNMDSLHEQLAQAFADDYE